MAIYVTAALVTALILLERVPRWLALVMGAAALLWAVLLAPVVFEQTIPSDTEEQRELGGLIVICGWMLALFFSTAGSRTEELRDG